MEEGDLHAFVERTRSVLAQSSDLSARNTELRVVLPFLETLGWDVYGPELEAEYVVEDARSDDGETGATDDGASSDADDHERADAADDGETADAGDQVSADATDGAPSDADDGEPAGATDFSPRESDSTALAVDYALTLDGEPVAFVVAQSPRAEPSAAAGRRLTTAMDAAGVDWGLLTTGRTYVFVTLEGGEPERLQCDLEDLPEHASVVAHYTRRAARSRHERRRSRTRRRVAERVVERRDAVVAAVEDALLEAADGTLADEFGDASAAFVDGVVDALSAGNRPVERAGPFDAESVEASEVDGSGDSTEEPAAPRETDDEPATPREAGTTETSASPPGEDRGRRSAAGSGDTADSSAGRGASDADEDHDDGEYVVRFFTDHASVGAIGHGTPAGATAQAVEYLIEQHALDARLDLPWPSDDDGRAVVNRDPVHPDGSRMDAARQLSNGYYLCTTLDVDASREVVETLADRSGLRTMFQGDW